MYDEELDISVEYDLGSGGTATVLFDNGEFNFNIEEFDENEYADIGVAITGDKGDTVINYIYNRNSLPTGQDVGKNLSQEDYVKIFEDTKLGIVTSIEKAIKSFF